MQIKSTHIYSYFFGLSPFPLFSPSPPPLRRPGKKGRRKKKKRLTRRIARARAGCGVIGKPAATYHAVGGSSQRSQYIFSSSSCGGSALELENKLRGRGKQT